MNKFKKVIEILLVLVLLSFTVYCLYTKEWIGCLVCIIALIIIIKFEDIQEISAFNKFNIKTKEVISQLYATKEEMEETKKKMDESLAEINKLAIDLKDTTLVSLNSIALILTYSGRIGNDRHAEDLLANQIERIAHKFPRENEVSITSKLTIRRQYIKWDYFQDFIGSIRDDNKQIIKGVKIQSENENAEKAIREFESMITYNSASFPTKDKIDKVLTDYGITLNHISQSILKLYLEYDFKKSK
ncbi:MAG: hypothetical protein ACM3O4_04405 [Ignavibacteriales bacterium]